jgi:hypothetical protein
MLKDLNRADLKKAVLRERSRESREKRAMASLFSENCENVTPDRPAGLAVIHSVTGCACNSTYHLRDLYVL